jgi:glycosyltransferase 2 family protein
MRKFIVAIVLLLGFIFVIGRLTEIQSIAQTLQRGNIWFIILAFIVEILWVFNCGASFKAIYRGMAIEERLGTLSLIVLAANSVNVVAPSGGVSGMAIFVSEARRRNYSAARVAAAAVLYLLFDYLGLIAVLAVGLVVLIRRNDLSIVVILASAALVGLAMLFSYLINLGMQSAVSFGNALAKLSRLVNRILRPFIHREYLSEANAHEFAHDAAEGLILIRSRPRSILPPLMFAITNKILQILVLTLVFLAFKVPISIGTIIACFSIGTLFVIVSPTPAGIGVVEGALTLALTSMYISLEDAAVITLSYRGITFWIPMLVGMISLRVLERVGINPNANNNTKADMIDAPSDTKTDV